MSRIISDYKFKRFVIDKTLSMIKLLAQVDSDVSVQGVCFCPFHDDTGHKSAKLYKNADKSEHIFCFAEHRIYKPSDITYRLLSLDLTKIFNKIWDKLPDSRKRELIARYENPIDVIPQDWKDLRRGLDFKWRNDSIVYSELLEELTNYHLVMAHETL